MFNQYYRLPEIINIGQTRRYLVTLTKDVSDLALLQALRAPLLELVVARGDRDAELVLRLQAGFEFLPYDADGSQQNSTNVPHQLLHRSPGQGARLYACGGRAPVRLLERLRRGLILSFEEIDSELGYRLESDGEFELIALEADLRLTEDPAVLQNAKSVLAREPEYGATSASLALLISELEQARRELQDYLAGADKHPGLAAEALRLEPMLVQRRQWLLRQYASTQERSQLGSSANDLGTDLDKLKRLLTCYELLSPPDVNAMVLAIADDDQ